MKVFIKDHTRPKTPTPNNELYRDDLDYFMDFLNGIIVQSIINDSDYSVLCIFTYLSKQIEYCVLPGESHPIVYCNFYTLSSYKVYRLDNPIHNEKCIENRNSNIRSISDDRRNKLTKAIKDVTSNEYMILNEGFLVLYSESDFKGNITFIDSSKMMEDMRH